MFSGVVLLLFMLWLLFRIFVLFFFFKQKTAYEMRISDWSSDVCSSDLRAEHARRPRRVRRARGFHPSADACRARRYRCRLRQEIGRASCRERVCQYV